MTGDSTYDSATTGYLVRRLWRDYLRHHRATIVVAVICMVIAAAMTAANAWLLQPALDEIFLNKNREMLLIIPAAVVAVALIGGAATYGQTIFMRTVGQRIIADMQINLFEHLLHTDVGLFADQSAGKLISRFTNDIQLMRNAVSTILTGMAKELLSMVFLIGVMFYQSWQLSLMAFVVFPLAIHPILRLGKRMRKISDGTQQQLSEFAGQLDQTFSAVRVVKAYNREDYEVARARGTVERLYALYMKASRVQALASPMIESIAAIAIAAIIGYGGLQVIEGQTTPGAFFSFIAAMIMAYKPVRSMAGLNTYLQEGLAAARRYFSVIDTEAEVKEAADAKVLDVQGGQITFDKVAFSYHPKAPALHQVTMEVPAGKMAALVGPSGAGKSTIMNLLLRYYDIDGGSISIDGQDIAGVTFTSLREAVALVSQEVMLFDDTVYANIAYGKEGATRDEVEAAAKAADAHGFISDFADGYETQIGPSGAKLSGGQRQRVSIARAILKNAPILLLDEATSSLDTGSEVSVQKALDELMQHRTTLVIAHRLSTVRHADIIYVLDQGRIVESGSHDVLLAKKGAYYTLHQSQFREDSAA